MNYTEIVKIARGAYSTRPDYGWGNVGSKQKSTAGWLAAFPVFEPHWQICWIEWDINDTSLKMLCHILKRIGLVASPGSGWVHGADGDVALTAGGGLRQVPGLSETFENAALVLISCFCVGLVYDNGNKLYKIWSRRNAVEQEMVRRYLFQ
ncbi:UNVERIFIED_CONTAM: Tocopherol cyclase, chloroplastic [Sesamum calycinum]|uniref:Tocopherol cyclase, chloroplastic n=1 Tax=Sesamum calycinum TaxID=2727403 RepID=A0AAW2M1E2_9LAMI